MILAIDNGLSNVDFLLLDDHGNRRFWYESSENLPGESDLVAYLSEQLQPGHIERVILCGSKTRSYGSLFWCPVRNASELEAFSFGARKIFGIEKGFVVSCGSGTACTYIDGVRVSHLGGSAMGGGFIEAFHKNFLGVVDVRDVSSLSLSGEKEQVDLSISEAVGKLDGLSATLTAVNLGKIRNTRGLPQDVSASLINMVGEVLGTQALLYARLLHVDSVYFTGRAAAYPLLKKSIDSMLKIDNKEAVFNDEEAQFAGVVGLIEMDEYVSSFC